MTPWNVYTIKDAIFSHRTRRVVVLPSWDHEDGFPSWEVFVFHSDGRVGPRLQLSGVAQVVEHLGTVRLAFDRSSAGS
jgi:hypothetical protein